LDVERARALLLRIVIGAGLAEMPLQELQRLLAQVQARHDAKPVHLGAGHGTDTVETADLERLDETGPHLRCDDEEAVGLAMIGGELGQEFVVADPSRRRQIRFASDLRPYVLGDLCR